MEANGNFEGERQALIKFSGPEGKHDNLIELLLSYGINDNQYLIFPWADGDLKDYWSRTQNDPTLPQHVQRLIGQCLGLAKGLCQVHHCHNFPRLHTFGTKTPFTKSRSKGRHGDIKPKNILYFADGKGGPGRLVIADFTLMRFHSDATTSFTYANQVDLSTTYRPPEVDKRKGARVSQKYDIWTLGCVYLEFITWHLLGCDAVYRRSFRAADQKEFESFSTVRLSDDEKRHGMEEDKFFNSTRLGQAVKPSVKRVSKVEPHEFACMTLLMVEVDQIFILAS
jgi:serine/threonine protein kinase